MVDASAERTIDGGLQQVAVLHSQRRDDAQHLMARIRVANPLAEAFVAPFSSVMVAHTGPGLIGVAWWWDKPGTHTA